MAIIYLNETNINEAIENNALLVIDFWAPWCGPCLGFSKVFEVIAAENPDITFAKINIDEEPGLQEAFEVMSIPQLTIFKNGVMIFSESGALPLPALRDLIEQARSVQL